MVMQTNRFTQETQGQPLLQIPQAIEPVQVQSTATTIYTADSAADFWIIHLWAANTTSSSTTYNLYFVPAGGSAGTGNLAAYQRVLPANTGEIITVAVNHLIPPGASIQALCATNDDVNIGGWGYDMRGQWA